MTLVLFLIVLVVLVGLAVIGFVAWMLLRPKKAPVGPAYGYGTPVGHSGEHAYPGQPVQPYAAPAPDGQYPAHQPAQPQFHPAPAQAPTQQYAPSGPPPAPPAPYAAPAAQASPVPAYAPPGYAAPAVPAAPAAQTWTAQVTEPGAAQVDDSELDETTRLREDLYPARPSGPPAPHARPTGLTPPA